jgi:signal transduction histidine kinase
MKSSLISTVSHELRTPLASIKGYATTLLADDVEWDRDSQRDFLTIISAETDQLNSLVGELLDISRIEAGSLNVTKTECDLDELIAQAAFQAGLSPATNLEVDLPADLPPLYADPRRIEVVLRNLLENAVKHGHNGSSNGEAYGNAISLIDDAADDGTPVAIKARVDDNRLFLYVIDQGAGIPEDQRERVFDSFYQADSSLNRSQVGAGLGLAICRGFVRAHGGEIWVEPTEKGATVAFWLPLANAETEHTAP